MNQFEGRIHLMVNYFLYNLECLLIKIRKKKIQWQKIMDANPPRARFESITDPDEPTEIEVKPYLSTLFLIIH